MELLVCGTSAAEAWPALFCECAACVAARDLGGRNVRSRAAYMLGEEVRIDFGPDSNLHQQKYGLRYDRIRNLLVTHSHDDHWFPQDLAYRRPGFSVVPPETLHVWGNAAVARKFEDACGAIWAECRMEFHEVRPGDSIPLPGGIVAAPLAAAHDPREECLNYRLIRDEKCVLLGHDTGWYEEAAWDRLVDHPLSLILFDCTYGREDRARGHLGCAAVVRARDEADRRGALQPGARVIATHFSHNGGWLHGDLEAYFSPHGIEVAYDGMRLEI